MRMRRNACYALTGAQTVPAPAATPPARIVKHVEDHFRSLPPNAPEFDHFAPSRYLIDHGLAVLPDVQGALVRFESLFRDVNALLPKAS